MKKPLSILLFIFFLGLVFYGCNEKPNSPEESSDVAATFYKGTETLGPPEIEITEGSGFVVAGTGLVLQPGTIDLSEIPSGATVKQVLLYWTGGFDANTNTNGDNTIIVNGVEFIGESIGGPTFFYRSTPTPPTPRQPVTFETFRYDITKKYKQWGYPATVSVEGMNNGSLYGPQEYNENDGAGILVIYDDGTSSEIQLLDGQDLAFDGFGGDLKVTVPQTFEISPSDVDRPASLGFFAGSVAPNRPNITRVTMNGNTEDFIDKFASNDGADWDSPILDIVVPAGTEEITVELISDGTRANPASLTWITSALSIDEPEDNQVCGRMTGGGSIFLNNDRGNAPRVTHGFEIHCDLRPPNNIEVNWPGGENFHLTELTYAECLDTEINQTPPHHAPFDTFIGKGYGKYNNVTGAYIEFIFVDAGEPGRNDTAEITIWEDDTKANQVLYVSGNLDRGNHQTHRDNGCGN